MSQLIWVLLVSYIFTISTATVDLCAIGSRDSDIKLNGNWTYQGTDSSNSNKDYWYHECFNYQLEWGAKYDSNNTFYVVTDKGTYNGEYAACNGNQSPESCPEWKIWETGTGWVADSSFIIKPCSYFLNETDCKNAEYLSTIGVTVPSQICIINPTYRTDLNGSYSYMGCDDGLPYFKHDDPDYSDDYNIHFDWCWAEYFISTDITSSITKAYCEEFDILECNQNWYEWGTNGPGGYSWLYDNKVIVQSCNKTLSPTLSPTLPTLSPTTFPTKVNTTDICIIGRYESTAGEDVTNTFINGRWEFTGYDENGYDYWKHTCSDNKYLKYVADLNNYYIATNESSYYGYCDTMYSSDSLPYQSDCEGNWYIYNGKEYENDKYVTAFNCNKIYQNLDGTSCYDASYIDYDIEDKLCLSDGTINEDINGEYELEGCDEGFPYYNSDDTNLYIHWDMDCGVYIVGPSVNTITFEGVCRDYNFLECNNNFEAVNVLNSLVGDDKIVIQDCPTPSPTSSYYSQSSSSSSFGSTEFMYLVIGLVVVLIIVGGFLFYKKMSKNNHTSETQMQTVIGKGTGRRTDNTQNTQQTQQTQPAQQMQPMQRPIQPQMYPPMQPQMYPPMQPPVQQPRQQPMQQPQMILNIGNVGNMYMNGNQQQLPQRQQPPQPYVRGQQQQQSQYPQYQQQYPQYQQTNPGYPMSQNNLNNMNNNMQQMPSPINPNAPPPEQPGEAGHGYEGQEMHNGIYAHRQTLNYMDKI